MWLIAWKRQDVTFADGISQELEYSSRALASLYRVNVVRLDDANASSRPAEHFLETWSAAEILIRFARDGLPSPDSRCAIVDLGTSATFAKAA